MYDAGEDRQPSLLAFPLSTSFFQFSDSTSRLEVVCSVNPVSSFVVLTDTLNGADNLYNPLFL
ncbi:MAG: hypothetical protein AB8B53_09215 [Flavobacteriales bacterium]